MFKHAMTINDVANAFTGRVAGCLAGAATFGLLGWQAARDRRHGWDLASTLARNALDATAIGVPIARGDIRAFVKINASGLAANAAAILLKRMRPELRPDRSDSKSMPSEHSANAFAIATALGRTYGRAAGAVALIDALAVGFGRVLARKHHWYDVLAGALVGMTTATDPSLRLARQLG